MHGTLGTGTWRWLGFWLWLMSLPAPVTYAQDVGVEPSERARSSLLAAQAHYEAERYALAAQGYRALYDELSRMHHPRASLALWNLGLALSNLPGRESDARATLQRFLDESTSLQGEQDVRAIRGSALSKLAELDARLALEGSNRDGALSRDGAPDDANDSALAVETGAPVTEPTARASTDQRGATPSDRADTHAPLLQPGVDRLTESPAESTIDANARRSPPTPVGSPEHALSPSPDVGRGWQVSPIGPVILALGGAALVAGGVVGGISLQQAGVLQCDAPSACPSALQPAYDEMRLYSTVADGLFVGGAATAALGLVLTLVLRDETDAPVTASCTPLGCDLHVGGTF